MGRKELAVKKVGTLNLREVAARATLRTVRQQGHAYIELRQVTKSSIFFCTLCCTQCFNEAVLFDHLRGNLHSKRYNSAKMTLLLPNPWPFNDGVLFFDNLREKDLSNSLISELRRDAIINGKCGTKGYGGGAGSKFISATDQSFIELALNHINSGWNACNDDKVNFYSDSQNSESHGKIRNCKGVQKHFSISYLLPTDEIINLELKIIGYGHIGASIHEDVEKSCKFSRIWCAWLGNGNSDGCDEHLASPKSDFAIVNISYTYDLGKKFAMEDGPPSPTCFFEIDDSGKIIKKRKKSYSDPEDCSYSFTEQYSSSFQHCSNPDLSYCKPYSRIHGGGLQQESRKQKCSIAERNCDICRQQMLPGKDVATLLNLKTGRFACSSRNINGAFHLFHASCLIHWVLLSEFELSARQGIKGRGTRGRKGKSFIKNSLFSSVFCPECQGTGANIEEGVLEKPYVPLSQTFLYKLKLIKAQKEWMRSPENLQKCSTGLCFPSASVEKLQGKAIPAKLLLFYRVGE